MLPSLLLDGTPSISSLTALTSPSPLKPRIATLPVVVPWLKGVRLRPGRRANSDQLPSAALACTASPPARSTEVSTLRVDRGPRCVAVMVTRCRSKTVGAEVAGGRDGSVGVAEAGAVGAAAGWAKAQGAAKASARAPARGRRRRVMTGVGSDRADRPRQ